MHHVPSAAVQATSHVPFSFNDRFLLIAAGALVLCATQARAADVPKVQIDTAPPPAATGTNPSQFAFVTQRLAEWKVVLGGGVRVAPKFEGSDEFKAMPLPFVSAVFGDTLRLDPRGASVNVFKSHGFSFSGRVGYDLGRKEDDSDHLRGLGDIDASAVVGGRIAYEAGPFEVYGALNRHIGGSEGLEAKFGANASLRHQRFLFSAGVSGTWADEKYMQTYFGVTAAQAVASGKPIYTLDSGIKRFDVEGSVAYMLNERWSIRGQVGVGFLTGDAANSPIVQTKTQPYGMLTIGYKF